MQFIQDYVFVIPVLVMVLAEMTKHLHEGVRNNLWFHHGGMPSSHSAFVTSLIIVVGRADGTDSGAFAIAVVFAAITWYDAAFVRSQVGKQAIALNVLQQLQQFSERIGHTVMEVVGGIAFGAIVTSLIVQLA